MKILSYDNYLDGGTLMLKTDKGTYYVDSRIGTKTQDEIYDKYPDDEGAEYVSPEIKEEIRKCLKGYHDQYLAGQDWLQEKFGVE